MTIGVVSAVPDRANDGMYLLDCRVNFGNSGGPLCDKSGNVVGLVTAKSGGGQNVDSYGMARPCMDLESFLKTNLPAYEAIAERPSERLEWDAVDRIVSPSVFMIMVKH